MYKQLDVENIDREEFRVEKRGDFTLINPKPNKWQWEEDELHLRSLLLKNGRVVSSGFPKFFNVGEDALHDKAFFRAYNEGAVELTKKLDGTLVIADRINGSPHLRTRGSDTLGPFHDEIMSFVEDQHSELLEALTRGGSPVAGHSWLFEYTGHLNPEDRIVVSYASQGLTLIGAINKTTLEPVIDATWLRNIADYLGVPGLTRVSYEGSVSDVMESVRSLKGEEGLVASFMDGNTPRLLKIKSAWYLTLHKIRSNLNETKLRQLCWLRNVRSTDQLEKTLGRMGCDFEVISLVSDEFKEYQREQIECERRFKKLQSRVEEVKENTSRRKDFVQEIRTALDSLWFAVAMKLYDEDVEDAWLLVESKLVNTSIHQLRKWKERNANEVEESIFGVADFDFNFNFDAAA